MKLNIISVLDLLIILVILFLVTRNIIQLMYFLYHLNAWIYLFQHN